MSLSEELEDRVGTTRSRVVQLAAADLTLEAAFVFALRVAGLLTAVDFSLGLVPVVFLVPVTDCVGASVTS